jgi:RNA 3'-terminal phosphate cyclase (ATP)
MLMVDGSRGEGGGQILRSCLALSLVTGRPFHLQRIRARRTRPGLQRQHLTAVRAAGELGDARVEGAFLGSQELLFSPRREVAGGEHRFDVGTAGSATLVLQTILPALLRAVRPSVVTVEGGTHNPLAPPFEFLKGAFLPLLGRMGARVNATLGKQGFYPGGGGRVRVGVEPRRVLGRLELLERGELVKIDGMAILSMLPQHIATRELGVLARELALPSSCLRFVEAIDPLGPGNALIVTVESRAVTEVFSSFGERGVRAETVAQRAGEAVRRYLGSRAAVAEHLADQLLLPLALGEGGVFRTLPPTLHASTNAEVLKLFLPVEISMDEDTAGSWLVRVEPHSIER